MPRRSRPLQKTSAALCALAVFAAPLALGGTHWLSILALAALSLAALATAAWGSREGLRTPLVVLLSWAVVGLIGVQLIPLPAGVLTWLSPEAGDLRALAGEPGGPLSLSTPSTWIALALQTAFAALLTAVVQLDRRRREWVSNALVFTGLAVALLSALHFVFGMERIYGVFRAQDSAVMSGFFGPFVNNNTLAGFLVLSGLAALGVASGEQQDSRARFALTAAVFALLGAMASGSRGGQAVTALGAALFTALAFARAQVKGSNARERARKMAAASALLLGAGLIGALFFMPDWAAFDPMHPESDGKLAAWPGAVDHALRFWLTGSGRGSFEYVHPVFQSVEGRGTVTHPENHLLQLASELGLPATLAIVGGFLWVWFGALRQLGRRTAPAVWGLAAGVAAAGAQQLVDFGLESAGLALPMAAALGLLVTDSRDHRQGHSRRLPRALWLGVTVGCAGLLAWQGPKALGAHPDADAAAVAKADAWRPLARAARQRHPGDGLIALAGAVRAAQTGAPLTETLGWVNQTLRLAPRDARPHLLAARALVHAGRTRQAALEYRAAAQKRAWEWNLLAREVAARLQRPQDLAHAVPDLEHGFGYLGNSILAIDAGRARATAARWLADHADDPYARDVLGRACRALGDWECVATEADWLVAHGRLATGWMLKGALARRRGDVTAARQALGALMAPDSDRRGLYAAANLAKALGDLPTAREAYDRLWRRLGTQPKAAANVLVRRAQTEEALGTAEDALRAWRAAHKHTPTPRTQAGVQRALAAVDHGLRGSSPHRPLEKKGQTADQAPHPTPAEP